jgi:hypothetical protein
MNAVQSLLIRILQPLGLDVHRNKGGNTVIMEDRLKTLMHDLGNAINDSLSDSERIAEAIGEIKHAGFDVFLVLEATIGFNKREENEMPAMPADVRISSGKMRFTSQDHRFLKALKIAVEEEK